MDKTLQLSGEHFILVLNSGSSSLKFAVYHQTTGHRQWSGVIKGIGKPIGTMDLTDSYGDSIALKKEHYRNIEDASVAIIRWLRENKKHCLISAIGYRLVQGGAVHRRPEIITEKLLEDLKELIFLAPNHLPDELSLINAFMLEFSYLLHVACFDTNFHRDMPDCNKYYPLPAKYAEQGLMRYGFHGLSYEYIMQKLDKQHAFIDQKKIVIAHLGNGSSMAAVSLGKGFDTTMGVSPIGGLVMATRCGDLDPGAVLFMLKQNDITPEELDVELSHESGLKAISGTGDMEEILNSLCDDKKAEAALTLYCHQAKKFIASLAASLGGIDMLIFTGGIGENSPEVRERICAEMDFMGLKIDRCLNLRSEKVISSQSSKVCIRVMKTSEESMIAMHTRNFLLPDNENKLASALHAKTEKV
ncbi:acetate/propionate family kinase [Pedobacter fastidiosus]|uniref:Acetate kinase n=1 Tax=Pedobacter fastidiosus TaxID=2765361 RepID=A0ABR7KS99_9SPHI|nr:acetate/propionate family kinase [Pedobacter fastidiosus]MBC6110946.1 acetate/propionate family kinase [Pedobacter fastidiosus]